MTGRTGTEYRVEAGRSHPLGAIPDADISDRCARASALAQQDLDMDTTISVVGANPEVRKALDDVGALDGVTVRDAADTVKE